MVNSPAWLCMCQTVPFPSQFRHACDAFSVGNSNNQNALPNAFPSVSNVRNPTFSLWNTCGWPASSVYSTWIWLINDIDYLLTQEVPHGPEDIVHSKGSRCDESANEDPKSGPHLVSPKGRDPQKCVESDEYPCGNEPNNEHHIK